MKGLKIVVLAKQVPDTRNVGKDAMKADGTVNRAALPAIFNPEDLNALEQALRIKDKIEGTTVHILTMGPGRAAEIIREAMYRGADGGYLLSDRAFAGSDTLATSYALACALRNLQTDLLICGRQAIDGDTAQVGPQVAEKLGLPQVTYAEDILDITAGKITIKRRLERGIEVVECPVPCVVTVNGSAAPCRPRNARYVMKYKYARATQEMQDADEDSLVIHNWNEILPHGHLDQVLDVAVDVDGLIIPPFWNLPERDILCFMVIQQIPFFYDAEQISFRQCSHVAALFVQYRNRRVFMIFDLLDGLPK